jgi:hypothetical protein
MTAWLSDENALRKAGSGVTRPVQAEHHFTGVLCSGHTGRQHRGADRRQAKNSHDSHEDEGDKGDGMNLSRSRRAAATIGQRVFWIPLRS